MFVATHQQGRGVGRLLINDLRRETDARSLTRVLIVAHPPAEEFYRAVGARVIEHLPPYGRITWSRPLLTLDPLPSV